jgi:hypothetical protein
VVAAAFLLGTDGVGEGGVAGFGFLAALCWQKQL